MQSVSCDESVSSFAAREDGCVRTEKKHIFTMAIPNKVLYFFLLGFFALILKINVVLPLRVILIVSQDCGSGAV